MGFFRRSQPVPEPAYPKFQVSVYEPEASKAAEFTGALRWSLESGGWWHCGTYGAMYRRQPAVRAVVDFLARNVAQLNGKVYERVSDTDRREVNDHKLAELLRHPNPITTRYSHMFATVADVAIFDRAYWRVIRRDRQVGIVRISPAKMQVDTIDKRTVYRLEDGTEIPRSQLVIFPGYSPDTDAEGISPLETLRRVLQEEMTVQQHRESMWQNAARAGGIISRPANAPAWSDAARTRFRGDLEALLSGPTNAGKIALLEEGMTWETPSFDPPDSEYIQSRRLTYEEVAIVYFGPIGGRSWLEASTKSGSAENHRQMYQDVLGPLLRFLQDNIELQLLPHVQPLGRSGTYFEFNLAEKLKGSFEEQARVITTAVGVPIMTVNEGRARVNQPRIDDPRFDMPVMPLNVMWGGQPAETVPVADRSTPETPPLMPGVASVLHNYFERQERSLTSPKARSGDRARWDRELADDLAPYAGDDADELAASINAVTFAAIDANAHAIADVFAVAKGTRAKQIVAHLVVAHHRALFAD